jgi:muramidase (phage lysozyme)
MNDIAQYTGLIAANSKDLALFSGSVYQGRQAFADVVEGMDKFKEGLMNTGLSQEQINAGAMSYLKLQSRIGLSQNKSTQELAEGTNKYLLEMDALSKITGETRKGMEDTMEAARSEERFAAKLQELRAAGRVKEAHELEIANVMLTTQSKQAAQGFRDLSTGMINTDAAQKLYIATQGKAMVVSDKISAGQIKAAEAVTVLGRAAGDTAKNNTFLAKAGVFGDIFGDFAGYLRLGIYSQRNLTLEQEKAEEEIKKQAAGADPAVKAATALRIAQQKGNEATERFIKEGIVASTEAMVVLANASTAAANALNKIAGNKTTTSGRTPGSSKEAPSAATVAKSNAKQTMAATTASVASNYTKNQMSPQEAKNVLEGGSPRDIAAFGGKEALTAIASGTATQGGGKTRATGAAPAPAAESSSKFNVRKLLDYIGLREARGRYDALVGKNKFKSDLTSMTVGEVLQFQQTMRSQGHESTALGKYQFINKTLLGLVKNGDLALTDIFNSSTQDRAATALLKGRGMDAFVSGKMSKEQFADAVAVEWASMPLGSGLSAAHGVGSNKAGGTREEYLAAFARDGGMFSGPASGYPATLHGDEAVIPLKDGAVPVSLSLKDALSKPSMMGQSEYGGYNMGPMSTDINAVKDIATAMGAFDRASQTITNPETWKKIINSGVAMNYDMGMAKIGTSIIPGIGIEIGLAVKELQAQKSVDTETAIKEIGKQFAEALPGIFQASMANKTYDQTDGSAAQEMAGLLQQLVEVTKSSNDIQTKILRSAN